MRDVLVLGFLGLVFTGAGGVFANSCLGVLGVRDAVSRPLAAAFGLMMGCVFAAWCLWLFRAERFAPAVEFDDEAIDLGK